MPELLAHGGKLIQDVGYFWDHADERYTLAHDYLIANYACSPSGLHYPLDFRRYRKREEYEKGTPTKPMTCCFGILRRGPPRRPFRAISPSTSTFPAPPT